VQESFEHIQDWLNEVNRYANEGTCKLLVGNKSDRADKVVSTDRAKVRSPAVFYMTNMSPQPCLFQ
jgi:DNA/RNA endonuclease G (NUC1)